VFFGSGVNNFGVMEVLDAVVDMSPPPGPRVAYTEVNRQREEKTIQPEDEGFSGVVFKVQANMDANHRDRIAFVRVASASTPRHEDEGAAHRQGAAPHQRGDLHEPAPRSRGRGLCGRHHRLHHHGGVQLGDTITDGPNLQFTGLPFFAPKCS
jgi:peptide chain release factor 3